jgi:Tol biopolymer transport system component
MWTPDGRLLFVSDRTGSLALWAVRIAGDQPIGEPELLVRDVGRLTMPLGLTDGGALYYQLQNGMIDVYSQSIDPSGLTPPDDPKPVSPTLIGANISSEWSPDGRDLAYVSMRGLVQNDRYSRTLAIHNVESGRLRNLQPALTSFIEPRWSPDGRRILVRGSDLRNHEGIFIIDVISGHTQPALLFPPDAVQSAVFQWSPDGSAVWYDKSGAGAIVARDLATGREDVVFKYKDESIQRLMQWPGFRVSPDGRSVAYTGFTFHENKAGTVVAMRTIGGATQEIARADAPERVEFQDWTPDGGGMLLIKRNTRERTNLLYEFRLDGRPPRSLDVNVAAIRDVSLRRDGKSITYTAGMNSTEVWVLENLLSSSVGGAGRDH